jgi:hypothetical protein
VTLVDGIPPVIANVSWTDPVKGLGFTVTLEASDNIGVTSANLSYWHGASRHVKAGMGEDLVVTITVPREIDGTLHFTVEVTDGAGNVATSEEMLVTPVNLPPEVDPVPAWQVVEGTESLLDLGPYVRDSNDDPSSLSVVLDDPNVSVEGLVLRGTFDVWVADLVLHLAITDGEDEVPLDLAVNIENVNDAPTILSVSPSNGSRIGEGRKITFTAEVLDEDGDDLVVTWMHGNGTIGSGSTLVYKKLPPGDQVVTVVVSDGVESVDAEVTLVILEDAGGQGVDPWVVLLLVAIAAIALALVWRIRFSK